MARQLNGVKQKQEAAERPEKPHACIGLPPRMTSWLLPDMQLGTQPCLAPEAEACKPRFPFTSLGRTWILFSW